MGRLGGASCPMRGLAQQASCGLTAAASSSRVCVLSLSLSLEAGYGRKLQEVLSGPFGVKGRLSNHPYTGILQFDGLPGVLADTCSARLGGAYGPVDVPVPPWPAYPKVNTVSWAWPCH